MAAEIIPTAMGIAPDLGMAGFTRTRFVSAWHFACTPQHLPPIPMPEPLQEPQ
jgi:hypothetical protein